MVATAKKYRGIPDCGAGPRFAYSTWPAASHNEQRSSTNEQTRYAESFGIGIAASVQQRTTTTGIFTTTTRRHNDEGFTRRQWRKRRTKRKTDFYHEGTKSRRVINERCGNYSDNLFVERRADADWSTPPAGTNPVVNNLYQGMSYDAVTGLYNERARWYSPSLGTWISQDLLQYINGANTYQFVGSSPVGAVDPSGEKKGDKWYGYNNRIFQDWAHREGKLDGQPDFTKDELKELYEDWQDSGKPDGEGHKTEKPECTDKNDGDGDSPEIDAKALAKPIVVAGATAGAGVVLWYVLDGIIIVAVF